MSDEKPQAFLETIRTMTNHISKNYTNCSDTSIDDNKSVQGQFNKIISTS